MGNREALHIVYESNQEIRIDRTDDFLKKFPEAELPESKEDMSIEPVSYR